MSQPIVLSQGAVTGNVGSCKIETTQNYVSSFYTQSIAVNSCTGEIVANNTYYDWSYVYFPAAFVISIIAMAVFIRVIFD